ncbi:MAG: TraB/GumN family protein, partial [Pseudomonadota bacterium]
LDERIAEIWEYSKYEAERDGAEADEIFDAFERTLLVERNRDWMPRILKETARGGAFIAVGALHLPYDDGILALLAAEGYEVTRLTP